MAAGEAAGQGFGLGTSVFGVGVPLPGELTCLAASKGPKQVGIQGVFAKRAESWVALSPINQANGLGPVSAHVRQA